MKILIFVAVLLAVCGQSAFKVQAGVIECKFKEYITNSTHFICYIMSIQQDENQNVITGNHKTGVSDSDVKSVENLRREFNNRISFDSIFCQKFLNLKRIDTYHLQPTNLVENALYGCHNLNYFQLGDADIKQIPDNFFAKSLNLEYLGLSGNRLETLPENMFQPLTKLRDLLLDENKLSTLNPAWFDNLKNLQSLKLESNNIEDLPKNIFVKLEKLKYLYLGRNNLVTIHADLFGEKPLLTHVYLWENKITSIDEKFIDDTAVSKLNMDGNICSDDDIRSRDQMKEKLQQCFNNYQSREVLSTLITSTPASTTAVPSTSTTAVPSTSATAISTTATPALSAATPKRNINWNLWLSLSLLTFSYWKF